MKKIIEEKNKPPTNQVVNHFFVLKDWDYKGAAFYKKHNIVYSRFVGPAKKLLVLCDGNLEEAKIGLDIVSVWANSRNLGWAIETVFKKWFELYTLQPKEKQPYFRGMKMIKKYDKWHCIDGAGNWLEFAGEESEIIYK